MGNPHAVIFVDDRHVDLRTLAESYGPALETADRFPKRTNVEFARVRGGEIDLVVWERGCGLTLACGTGACATVVAACLEERLAPGAETPCTCRAARSASPSPRTTAASHARPGAHRVRSVDRRRAPRSNRAPRRSAEAYGEPSQRLPLRWARSNRTACLGVRGAGGGRPRCSYARRVAWRPRGVRIRKPSWIRYGS